MPKQRKPQPINRVESKDQGGESGFEAITPEIKKKVLDFIDAVRNNQLVQPNFVNGPDSSFGPASSVPFEGYDANANTEQMQKWEAILKPAAFDVLKKSSSELGKIFYKGKTFQAPTTSSGKGSYYHWDKYPGCWMDIRYDEQDVRNWDDPNDEGVVGYESRISIALEMSPEEKEQFLQDLERRYDIVS